jgi:hypothetical protein
MKQNSIRVTTEKDGVLVEINFKGEREKFDLLASLFGSLINKIGKDEVLEMVKWGEKLIELEKKEVK